MQRQKNAAMQRLWRHFLLKLRLFEFGGNRNDFLVVRSDEVDNVRADVRRVDVGFDTLQRIEYGCARLVDVAVALGYVVDLGVGETMLTHDYGVYSVVRCRVVGDYNVGRHIAHDSAAAFNHYPVADLAAFVQNHVRRQDAAQTYYTVAGKGDAVADNCFAFDLAVVAYVRVGHDEAVVADNGCACGAYAAVNDDMFADNRVIADMAVGRFSFPSEILRVGSDNGALIYFSVAAYRSSAHHRNVWHYLALVADFNVGIDEGEGVDGNVLAYFGRGVNVG